MYARVCMCVCREWEAYEQYRGLCVKHVESNQPGATSGVGYKRGRERKRDGMMEEERQDTMSRKTVTEKGKDAEETQSC